MGKDEHSAARAVTKSADRCELPSVLMTIFKGRRFGFGSKKLNAEALRSNEDRGEKLPLGDPPLFSASPR
jgi:hypothetical protein